jgi:hypothetical protein
MEEILDRHSNVPLQSALLEYYISRVSVASKFGLEGKDEVEAVDELGASASFILDSFASRARILELVLSEPSARNTGDRRRTTPSCGWSSLMKESWALQLPRPVAAFPRRNY